MPHCWCRVPSPTELAALYCCQAFIAKPWLAIVKSLVEQALLRVPC